MAVQVSEPSTPRNGSYKDVMALTTLAEGEGGEVRVEVDQCGECSALVENSAMPNHESWHAGQGGAEPKSKVR